VPKKNILFWHDIRCEKPYGIVRKLFACNLKMPWDNVDIKKRERKEREKKMFANMIVLNTVSELTELLNSGSLETLVNRVAFASDLLARVRANDNQIAIDDELGFMDDGGWIEIDEMGYVVDEAYLP
jgi:hypothetical protein